MLGQEIANSTRQVKKWTEEIPDAHNLNSILSSNSVKSGHNHKTTGEKDVGHFHGALGGHGKTSGSLWTEIQSRDLGAMEGSDGNPATSYLTSSPQPGLPGLPHHSPNFGYQNLIPRPESSGRHSHGAHLTPEPQHGNYQSATPPAQYQHHYGSQPPYGASGDYQQGPPYPMEQPPYGAPPLWQPGFEQGPGYWRQGPPPPGFQGGTPPQHPYGVPQYPPQQPPYGGGYQQYPPGGGYNY
jgi:hypothetical protein